MPAVSKVNFDEFVKVATKYDLWCENSNSIKGPSAQCWTDISKDLNYLISSKYVYIIVKENRNDICNKLFLNGIPTCTDDLDNINRFDDFHSSTSSETFSEDTLNFNITLSADEWGSLYDNRPQIYKRSDKKSEYRTYHTLQPHKWTSVIHEHFYEQTKLPCSIVYKYAKIFQEGQVFLKIAGHCSTCNSTLSGNLASCPSVGSRVIIRFNIKGNFKSCRTHKKRRVLGDTKVELTNQLKDQNKSASFIQRKMARSIMDYGDPIPSHIPSLNAIRLIKHNALKNDQVHDNPIISILSLKGTPPYNNIIREIGHDKFYVHYWTASEVNNYRVYAKKTSVPTISIDATGSVVKKMTLFSGRQTHNIFLYEIVVNDRKNQNQFCVAHMLSEKHDNNSISYWLAEWLRDVKSPPLLVVTDQSLALMHAVTKTFTQFSSLDAYISNCSKLVSKEPGFEIPKCMIRNDFNHVMHLISTWPELKSCTQRVKQFYMRAIGLLVVSTSIGGIKTILKSIFTTALHECDGVNDDQEPTACENAKRFLKLRIATHIVEINYENEANEEIHGEEETDDVSSPVASNSIFQDMKHLYEECEQTSQLTSNLTGDHDNMQYSPSLAKRLLNFCKYITCWSALMVPIFEYGSLTETSASSESMFKDLKSIVFKHKTLPLRLDDFLVIHVESIIGMMNLMDTSITQLKEDTEHETKQPISEIQVELKRLVSNSNTYHELKRTISETENETEIPTTHIQDEPKRLILDEKDEPEDNIFDFTEDWMGLGKTKNKTKKSKYITKDPTILHCNDKSRSRNSVIGVLRNGSVSELKSIHIDNEYVSLINTCTFDSISQVMFCAYADSELYSEFVERKTENKFMELVSHAVRDGITVQSYRKRGLLLKDLFTTQCTSELTVINAACTAQFMLNKIFVNFPSIVATMVCPDCVNRFLREEIIVTVNLPTDDLIFLQDIMEDFNFTPSYCKNCDISMTQALDFKDHLIIEPVVPLTQQRKLKKHLDLNIQLKDIPTILKVKKELFNLRGIVNFISPISSAINAIGHYIAYCYREPNKTWEKYDDFQQKSKTVRPTTEAQNCQYLIYSK